MTRASQKIEADRIRVGTVKVTERYATQISYVGRSVGDGSIAVMDSTPPIAPAVTCAAK